MAKWWPNFPRPKPWKAARITGKTFHMEMSSFRANKESTKRLGVLPSLSNR
jgi:hypothetical protein